MECDGLNENELQRLILMLNHQGMQLLKGLKGLGGVALEEVPLGVGLKTHASPSVSLSLSACR